MNFEHGRKPFRRLAAAAVLAYTGICLTASVAEAASSEDGSTTHPDTYFHPRPIPPEDAPYHIPGDTTAQTDEDFNDGSLLPNYAIPAYILVGSLLLASKLTEPQKSQSDLRPIERTYEQPQYENSYSMTVSELRDFHIISARFREND